jgi:very-short-patch-repair endonuclease
MVSRLTPVAKTLRKQTTETEQLLWKNLRAKRFAGLKFRRQQPIGPYIVDFVCFEKRVIVELDGGQHMLSSKIRDDSTRDRWLREQGYRILRFWDNEAFTNTREVLDLIWIHCSSHPPLNPLPSREGEK